MQTKIITTEVKVQDEITEAIAWLEKEYPKGLDLVYTDYRDSFNDMKDLQETIKEGNCSGYDFDDSRYEGVSQVLQEYSKTGDFELSDDVREAMEEWIFDHDTSDEVSDLLKNTGSKLFYIETEDYSMEDKSNILDLIQKYAKTDEEKKEIEYVVNEQYYEAPVSFYFYANALNVFKAIHSNSDEYVTVTNTYFSTIDRTQGSNWLGNHGVFNLCIPKKDFIENVYVDEAKGNGYGWGDIAGQSGYDEATIGTTNAVDKVLLLVGSTTTEDQKRELMFQTNWDKTKKCIFGDTNWGRHEGKKNYINEYPCGNKCEACGTFWID